MRISNSASKRLLVAGVLLGIGAAMWLFFGSAVLERDQCGSLSDEEATEWATKAFHRTFGDEPASMLGGRNPAQLRSGRPARESFGRNSVFDSTNVPFQDVGTNHVVIIARIFRDCDIEWRPQ